MVGPNEVKWKGIVSVRFLVNYAILKFYLTHNLDTGYFKILK